MESFISKSAAARLPFGLPGSAPAGLVAASSSSSPDVVFETLARALENFVNPPASSSSATAATSVFAGLLAPEGDGAPPAAAQTAATTPSSPLASRGASDIAAFLEQHPTTLELLSLWVAQQSQQQQQQNPPSMRIEEHLARWIFGGGLDDRFLNVFGAFMRARSTTASVQPSCAPLLAVTLRALTALEVLLRRVPGMRDSDEGLGLLSQIFKCRVLLRERQRADNGNGVPTTTQPSNPLQGSDADDEARAWDTLLILLRCVFVDGKGMHLRNVIFHGYVLPRHAAAQSTLVLDAHTTASSSASASNDADSYDNFVFDGAVAPGAPTLLMCAFLAGFAVKRLARCLRVEPGAADLAFTLPDGWNRDLFAAAFQQEQPSSSSSSLLASVAGGDPLLAELLSVAPDDKAAHEVLVPVLVTYVEGALRGLVSHVSAPTAGGADPQRLARLKFATYADAYFMCDLEDTLSWQGPSLQLATGPLRRGIQRIRDVSDAFVAAQQKRASAAAATASVATASPSGSGDLPRNALIDVLGLDLHVAWRGLFLTLLPVGPRLRDMLAHGKLSAADAAPAYNYCASLLRQTVARWQQAKPAAPPVPLHLCAGTASYFVDYSWAQLQRAVASLQEEIAKQIRAMNESAAGSQDGGDEVAVVAPLVQYSISTRNGVNKNIKPTRRLFDFPDEGGDSNDGDGGASTAASAASSRHGPLLIASLAELVHAFKDNDASACTAELAAALTALHRGLFRGAFTAPDLHSHPPPGASWIAGECDAQPYAIRSSLAAAQSLARLLDAARNMIEASLRKWRMGATAAGSGSKRSASKAAAGGGSGIPPQETLPVLQVVLALVQHGVAPLLVDYRAVIADASSKDKKGKAKDGSAASAGRCLLDVTLPVETAVSKIVSRNVPVIEAFAEDPALPALGKVALACFNWAS